MPPRISRLCVHRVALLGSPTIRFWLRYGTPVLMYSSEVLYTLTAVARVE